MKKIQKINLDNRLFLCAQNVRPCKIVADIGTDHAYLPIYLVVNNITPRAIVTDLREGPLLNAQKNILKYNLETKIETRLSDGLNEVSPDEVDDIVIAGMGGELIAKIVVRATWLKDPAKHLILQPMSAEQELREFLAHEKFKIVSEKAAVSHGKVYTVMSVFFDEKLEKPNGIYPYIGALQENLTPETILYIKRTIRDLKNKQKGYTSEENFEKIEQQQQIISKLEEFSKEEK